MQNPIAVFGLGISNLAVIKALIAQGRDVIAWDDNEDARNKAADLGATVQEINPEDCECLVLAPGVPLDHPVVTAAQNANIEILCDIELRYKQGWACKTVGITGTNGKSTTTALIGHVLQENGVETAVGGNIGTAIFDLDVPGENGVLVLELSSFQLDICPTFRPDISILLNITPDHLDRHGTMESYAAAKARMFEGQGKAVIIGTDDYSQNIAKQTSREILSMPEDLQEYPTLRGAHNTQNMQAAYAVCQEFGLAEDQILSAFQTFPGLPHRQYLVRKIGNVEYINDSKATNAEAASKALSSYDNIYWIVGGRAKEGGLEGIEKFLPHVKKAYLIGEATEEFSKTLEAQKTDFESCETLERAVEQANQDAAQGVVLLSPAAASYDQYKNFAERGDHFTRLVEVLDE